MVNCWFGAQESQSQESQSLHFQQFQESKPPNAPNQQLTMTLPETNKLHLKMDGWNTSLSFWGPAYFQG